MDDGRSGGWVVGWGRRRWMEGGRTVAAGCETCGRFRVVLEVELRRPAN